MPMMGEIQIFCGNYAPEGWAECDGQLLQISQYEALFSLLGTIYGGDGHTTFALPDLQGRVAIHEGQGPGLGNRPLGSAGGADSVTLKVNELPAHNHALKARNTVPAVPNPGTLAAQVIYHPNDGGALVPLDGNGIDMTPFTATQAHENRQPYLSVGFIMSLYRTYPSRN